jgi:hypothetical protein
MTTMKPPTLTELANRIHAHLRRFEANPKINKLNKSSRLHRYFEAGAYRAGRYVRVVYHRVGSDSGPRLTREQATSYLEKLDAGKTGTHWSMGIE